MSLEYPGESFALSDFQALDDQALQVIVLENEPKNLNDALNLASQLEAFDIMSSTGPEAEKANQDSYVPWPAVRNPQALVMRRCWKKSESSWRT